MQLLKLISLSLIISSFFVFSSCDEEEVVPKVKSIVELAQETSELSSLVAALQRANLVSALQSTDAKTVFAPNNQAFQNLLDSNPAWNTLDDIDVPTLTSVLLYHVISGSVRSTDLTNTYVNTLSTGPNGEAISLQIDLTNGVKFNGSTTPITTDVEASNGVVHIVDEVMLPPTVVNHALNNTDFSILVSALTRADLTTDYVSVLSGEGPFTIFAPTNQAFLDLLAAVPEWSSLDDIPVETLAAVLNYHTVSGANVQSDELSDGQSIGALEGNLTVDLSNGAKLSTTSDQSVEIILTDVQGTNGVIHVVNQVLLP